MYLSQEQSQKRITWEIGKVQGKIRSEDYPNALDHVQDHGGDPETLAITVLVQITIIPVVVSWLIGREVVLHRGPLAILLMVSGAVLVILGLAMIVAVILILMGTIDIGVV